MLELSHIQFTGAEPPPRSVVRRLLSRSSLARRAVPLPSSARRDIDYIDPFLVWLLERAGLDSTAYRRLPLQRRLLPCLRKLRVASGNDARKLLEKTPELLPIAVNTVLIGVTEFFRDKPVFEFLRETVIPELLDSKKSIRVYAPGVSGGQELYSVAILLAEAGALAHGDLLGLDCRADAIRSATAASFCEESLRSINPARRARYFQRDGACWTIKPELRRKVRWTLGNVATFEERADWDLILFRNVAIYFQDAHASAVWQKLCSQLRVGGFLITGKAEKPDSSLPLVRVAASVYKKI